MPRSWASPSGSSTRSGSPRSNFPPEGSWSGDAAGGAGVTQRLRVAVVGLGIGRSHLRAYAGVADKFEVAAVCDIDRQRADDAAEEHGVSRVATDLAEVCRMDDVDVVDICTPPH